MKYALLQVLKVSILEILLLTIENPEALPTIKIDEPTMSMSFTINDSPFFGQEG